MNERSNISSQEYSWVLELTGLDSNSLLGISRKGMAQAEIERAFRHFRVNSLNCCGHGNNDDLHLSPILNALSMIVDALLNCHLGDFFPHEE